MKVCIIGAGISGIVSAITCKLNNLDFIILEKSKSIGGCWYNLAKDHTYLQTLGTEYTIFYKYFLGELSNETKDDVFPGKNNLLLILRKLVSHYSIEDKIMLNTTVVNVKEVGSKYQVTTSKDKSIFDYVMVCIGSLGKPKEYQGSLTIKNGYSIKRQDIVGKKIVISGCGANAIEILRICKLYSKDYNLVCRRPKWVVPKNYLPTQLYQVSHLKNWSQFQYLLKCKVFFYYISSGLYHMLPDLTSKITDFCNKW